MEWFLFWVGVNFLIGYFIGKPKDFAIGGALVCVLLGPIGWIIVALSGNSAMRICPYCAENVKQEALLCRHCGRELPKVRVRGAGPPRLSEKYDLRPEPKE